jgi:hypothetical protein
MEAGSSGAAADQGIMWGASDGLVGVLESLG